MFIYKQDTFEKTHMELTIMKILPSLLLIGIQFTAEANAAAMIIGGYDTFSHSG